MKQNGFLGLLFNALFLTFIAAPLVVVIAVSFTDKGFISLPFDGASLRWFRAILDNDQIVDAFWLSVRLALVAATIGVALALPAALAIARYRFPGRGCADRLFPLAHDDSRRRARHRVPAIPELARARRFVLGALRDARDHRVAVRVAAGVVIGYWP